MAVSIFFDTPMNGHRPRNCTSTKLLTRMALTMIRASSVMHGYRRQLAGAGGKSAPIIGRRSARYKPKGCGKSADDGRLSTRSAPDCLLHALTRTRAGVRAEQMDLAATGAGGQNHALADAKLHLARRQVGHIQRQPALQHAR